MENKGRVGSSSLSSSSSSSFTTQLFGPKEPSSSTMFNSIFPHPSKDYTRNSLSSKHDSQVRHKESKSNKNNRVVEPCHLSSSLYYGGQDVYSQYSTNNQTYIRRREDDDVNSQDASRGNWWQGSLYY